MWPWPNASASMGFQKVDDETFAFDTEPILAWRVWRLFRDRPGRLISTNYELAWPKRKPMRAHCLPTMFGKPTNGVARHEAPSGKHGCGIYSVRTPEQALTWCVSQPVYAIGVLALWGTVLECPGGYKAEFAYPQRLWLATRKLSGEPHRTAPDEVEPAELAMLLVENYGIPCSVDHLDGHGLLEAA